jgi:predicted SnoaL-like aldol condensation-catalyzing enzyme
MQTFGEMAIVAPRSNKKIKNKLADRGNMVMFVVYSEVHEKDVFKFWHLATNKTLISWDVIWNLL